MKEMTIAEAARILDPETSRDALWKYEDEDERLEACNEACRIAAELLQEQDEGLLIKLPCKVGEYVYDISDGTAYETKVLSFSYHGDHWACRTASSYPDLTEFGTRIFLTREEAEEALTKRRGDNG